MSSQTHDQLSLETDALYDPSYGWPGNEGSQYYQAYGSASSVPGHFGSADIPTGYSVPTASTSSLPDLDTQSTTSSQSSAGPRRIENLEDALAQYNIPQKVEQSRARAQGRGKSKRDQQRPSPYPIQASSLYMTVPKVQSYPAWPAQGAADNLNIAHAAQHASSEPYRSNSHDGDTDSLSSASNSISSASFTQSSANLRAASREDSEENVTQRATDLQRASAYSRSSSFTFPQHGQSAFTSHAMESVETSRPSPAQMHSMYAASQRRVARSASSQSLNTMSSTTTPSSASSSWLDSPNGTQTSSSASSPTVPLFASGLHSIPACNTSSSAAGPPPSRHNTRSSVGSLLGSSSRSQSTSNLMTHLPVQSQATKVKRGAKLSQLDRKRICQYARDSPKMTQDIIGSIFKVDRTTISKILSQKDQWLAIEEPHSTSPAAGTNATNLPEPNVHRSALSQSQSGQHLSLAIPRAERTSARFPQIETQLTKWAQSETLAGKILNDQSIRNEAVRVRDSLGMSHEQFKASDGWMSKYKIRAGIIDGRCTQIEQETGSRSASSSFSGGEQYQHSSLGMGAGQTTVHDFSREPSMSVYGTEDGCSAASDWSPYGYSGTSSASVDVSRSFGITAAPSREVDQHNYQSSQYGSAPNTPGSMYFSALSMASPAVDAYAEAPLGPNPYFRPDSSQSVSSYTQLPRASPEDLQRPSQTDGLAFCPQHLEGIYPAQHQSSGPSVQSSVSTNDMISALSTIQRYLSERPKFCNSSELDLLSSIQHRARDYLRSEASTPQQVYHHGQPQPHQQMYMHAPTDRYPHQTAPG